MCSRQGLMAASRLRGAGLGSSRGWAGGRDLSALVCVLCQLSGEKETPGIGQRLKQHKGTQEDLGGSLLLKCEGLFYCLPHTVCFQSSWLVALISSSNILPALKHAISLHAPPSCFVALLVRSGCQANGTPESPIRSSTANQSF